MKKKEVKASISVAEAHKVLEDHRKAEAEKAHLALMNKVGKFVKWKDYGDGYSYGRILSDDGNSFRGVSFYMHTYGGTEINTVNASRLGPFDVDKIEFISEKEYEAAASALALELSKMLLSQPKP